MEKKTKRGRKWLLSLLALAATCLYPCLFLFAQNAGEARAQDMIPFFLLFLATALAALAVYGLILRDVSRAAVMSCLSMLAVINFTLLTDAIERKIPWLYSRYVMILTCLILGCAAVAILLVLSVCAFSEMPAVFLGVPLLKRLTAARMLCISASLAFSSLASCWSFPTLPGSSCWACSISSIPASIRFLPFFMPIPS